MDFVDWCWTVLRATIDLWEDDASLRRSGLAVEDVAERLFGPDIARLAGFDETTRYAATWDALEALAANRLVHKSAPVARWRPLPGAEDVHDDPLPLWRSICAARVRADRERLLLAVNRLSPRTEQDHVWIESVPQTAPLDELGWPASHFYGVADRLREMGLLRTTVTGSELKLQATLAGLVWETRRAAVFDWRVIDDLVAQWETTSVEFKSGVHTNTASEKAEFVKDLLGLTNTRSSPPRLMIIGFDDKTHEYVGPPDPKLRQDHLEQLLARYIEPFLQVNWSVVPYRMGPVGRIEVLREPQNVPYMVKESVGFKGPGGRRMEAGQIFVRHGTQTEAPTAPELEELRAEGERTKAADSGA